MGVVPRAMVWYLCALLWNFCFLVTPCRGQNKSSFECRLPQQLGSRGRDGARRPLRFAYNASNDSCTLVWVANPTVAPVAPVAPAGTAPPPRDNASLFVSDSACMRSCSRKGSSLYPQGAEVCHLPSDPGSCRALFRLWFFNAQRRRCELFNYGGCHGNGNRFIQEAKCSAVCRHLMDPGAQDRTAGVHGDHIGEGAVAVAVFGFLFGVTVAVIAAVFAVKRRKHKQSPAYSRPQDCGLQEESF